MNKRFRMFFDTNKQLIDEDFPWFEYHKLPSYGEMLFGEVWDNAQTHKCLLRVICGPGYPDVKPMLTVAEPRVLRRIDGKPLKELRGSHDYHCLGCNEVGELILCYTNEWDPMITLLSVLSKGMVWWEGYSYHLRTGNTIDKFFKQ